MENIKHLGRSLLFFVFVLVLCIGFVPSQGFALDEKNGPSVQEMQDEDGQSAQTAEKYNISAATTSIDPQAYTGAPIAPKPQIMYEGVGCLVEGKDYVLSYENNISLGLATIYVAGIGDFTGARKFYFQITAAPLDSCTLSLSQSSYVYSGRACTPSVTVKQGAKTLDLGTDYQVSYSNNINVGTASVTVTGKGNYAGTKTVTFQITQKEANDFENGDNFNAPAVTGTWKKSSGKWWFAYDSKTKSAQEKSYPANEWVVIQGKKYHFDSKGLMSARWLQQGKSWYWLGNDGAMKTGWAKVGGKWYYMASNGVMQTGWQKVSSKWYYLASSGAMKTGWVEDGPSWYYCNGSGVMLTGWQKVRSKWYYLSPSNGKMKTGFYSVGDTRYYSNSSGAMLTGWQKISNEWYYFAGSGAMQMSKWISNKYWVGSDGVMATNSWVDNGRYYVNAKGEWVKGNTQSTNSLAKSSLVAKTWYMRQIIKNDIATTIPYQSRDNSVRFYNDGSYSLKVNGHAFAGSWRYSTASDGTYFYDATLGGQDYWACGLSTTSGLFMMSSSDGETDLVFK